MAYRLDPTLEPADALRATAMEQLQDAIDQLRNAADPAKAVHEARKDLKKVRSLLRLGRPNGRRAINAELRDIAAQLAGARDADVMVATVDDLRVRFAGRLPARSFQTIGRRFARAAAETTIDPATIAALEAQRDAVGSWAFKDLDLVGNATAAYARGRAERRSARKRPEAEALHEWRKRVKDLWYHHSLLEAAWPGPLEAFGDEAHTLSDHLGDDHDLAVLIERFQEQEWPSSIDSVAFLALCEQRRAELQQDAFALAAKVYAEKPDAFARRLRAYLR